MRMRIADIVLAWALVFCALPVSAVTFDYSNTVDGSMLFDPADNCYANAGNVGCISFPGSGVGTFPIEITSGTASGLLGSISGIFGVGPITTTTTTMGVLQEASVSGMGQLSIFDGPHTLTADLEWNDIFTFGSIGGVNVSGALNLSSIVYTGSNPDLLALASATIGTQSTSFQFEVPTSLQFLFDANSETLTSFSGSIGAVPIPPAVWLFGSGVLGMIVIARRQRARKFA